MLSMFEISMDQRYENFIDTVCNCASPVYWLNDEQFRYILFEKLSVEVFSVFSETNLNDLIEVGMIQLEDRESCLQIRVLFGKNEEDWRKLHDIKKIQGDSAFAEIRSIAGKLLKKYCGYSLLDKATKDMLWNNISHKYQFSPAFEKSPYPWIQIPSPCRSFPLTTVWNEEQEALVNSFFVQLDVSELRVLDWQHDCFSFDPGNFSRLIREYHDDERNCNVYFPSFFPDGDYHFFLDQDGKYALYGHPWIHEIVVYGQELIDLFETNTQALGLGNLFIRSVDVEDEYTREGTYVVSDGTYEIACYGYMENYHKGDPYTDRVGGFLAQDIVASDVHEFQADRMKNWEFRVNGVICDGRSAIRVGGIHISLDSPVPGDLKDGEWVSAHISRMDV